jgi:hypothetical protein
MGRICVGGTVTAKTYTVHRCTSAKSQETATQHKCHHINQSKDAKSLLVQSKYRVSERFTLCHTLTFSHLYKV